MSPRLRLACLVGLIVCCLAWSSCEPARRTHAPSTDAGRLAPRPARSAVPLRVPAPAASTEPATSEALGATMPESVGIDGRALAHLTEWVRDTDVPIFSILVSRDGKLVYELYTSGITRDDAHYMMSVTKSFTSALVGIAIDQGLVRDADASLAQILPQWLFASEKDRARFAPVTLKHVLGMSALDAQVPPHENSPEAEARQRAFLAAPNRARFALSQDLLPEPGVSFQYTDITPLLAAAAVSYAAHSTLLEFAQANLFGPLGFQNVEWMHEDASGIDNGAYGLRVRPIDMQKFGVLYLQGGRWNGRQILSEAWVKRSFEPWIRNTPALKLYFRNGLSRLTSKSALMRSLP